MNKKIKNILLILTFVIIFFSIFSNVSWAEDSNVNDIINEMKGVDASAGVGNDNSILKGVNIVYTLIRVAGTGIALLMVIVLGIKYMMTSVEEKAEIKKQAIPILVGSAFIFATSNLLTMVAKIVEEE